MLCEECVNCADAAEGSGEVDCAKTVGEFGLEVEVGPDKGGDQGGGGEGGATREDSVQI